MGGGGGGGGGRGGGREGGGGGGGGGGREPLVLDRIEESFSASVNVISCDSDRRSEYM